MPEEKKIDPQGQSTITTDPSKSGEGESTDDLPEQFKGKSASDIAKSYLELQKTMGKQADEVGQTRQEIANAKKALSDWEALGQIIEKDPVLFNQLEAQITLAGRSPSQNQDPALSKILQEVSDTRLATQGQIFEKFEGKYGIDRLKTDDKKGLQSKVGNELHDLLDPKHSKNFNQVLASIPLDQLPMYLEKAYHLATRDDEKERSRMQGMIQARQNSDATFSSMPSSSIRQSDNTLSPEEKKVAKRLGIGEDKYLKQKKEIAKQYN